MLGSLGVLFDLVLPGSCACCGDPGPMVCPHCGASLRARPHAVAPTPTPPGLPPTWAALEYAGCARAALLAHKERGRLGLVRPLGDALGATVAAALTSLAPPHPGEQVAPVLVPVPSSTAALRARGHDHGLRLARRAAWMLRRAGWVVAVRPALTLVRPVADQAGLSAPGRAANLAGAFGGRPGGVALHGRPVVVVDDVLTTGSTLSEAARGVRAAGGEVLAAVVVAATRLHRLTNTADQDDRPY